MSWVSCAVTSCPILAYALRPGSSLTNSRVSVPLASGCCACKSVPRSTASSTPVRMASGAPSGSLARAFTSTESAISSASVTHSRRLRLWCTSPRTRSVHLNSDVDLISCNSDPSRGLGTGVYRVSRLKPRLAAMLHCFPGGDEVLELDVLVPEVQLEVPQPPVPVFCDHDIRYILGVRLSRV